MATSNTATRRAKIENMLAAQRGAEPTIRESEYTRDMMHALNWYNEHIDEKKRRKFALEYFAKLKKKQEVLAISKATDFELRQLSVVCHLLSREQFVSETHKEYVKTTVEELVRKYQIDKPKKASTSTVTQPAVVSVQDRIEESARKHAAEFDAEIDNFTINKSSEFSAKNYLLANSVSGAVSKKIGEMYSGLISELQETLAGSDKQLVEGYSNFTKRELKKFLEFVQSIVADCQQQVQTAKVSRAPRKRKPTSPTKVVSKMKYMKEFAELKLKSIKPELILAATELWVYNTKYRKIQVYKAESGSLDVKGTSVLGFSVKESQSFTLRKPEEFFKGLSLGKRALNGAIKKLTTKPATPNGRINEECVLIGAF